MLIQRHFAAYSWSGKISDWILTGTDMMLKNDGSATNQNVFLNYFSEKSGLSAADIWEQFMKFYEEEFDSLQEVTDRDQQAIEFIERAVNKDYKLILATQPIFPEIAIRKRLEWAGLGHISFQLITDITKMSASKPSDIYFRQVLDYINASASECIMIGNEAIADMAAADIGIKTFFLETDPETPIPQKADFAGDFNNLANLLNI